MDQITIPVWYIFTGKRIESLVTITVPKEDCGYGAILRIFGQIKNSISRPPNTTRIDMIFVYIGSELCGRIETVMLYEILRKTGVNLQVVWI